jgi:periplasmic protein CpxP/Spy
MTIVYLSRISILALAATLGGGAMAQAQDSAAAAAPMAQRHWDPAAMKQRMEAHRAERTKALHDVLSIRADQETAFATFAASMQRPDRGDRGKKGGGADARAAMASMTTPERLDRMARMIDERTTRMRDAFHRRADAAKALYAVLGPDQRRVMDALPALKGHEHGGGMGRGRHGMMGPGGHGGPGGGGEGGEG